MSPTHSILYEVSVSARTSDIASLDREMQAVISSFHIENSAVPGDRKR